MKLSSITSILCLFISVVSSLPRSDSVARSDAHHGSRVTHAEAVAYTVKFFDFLRDSVPDRTALAHELFTDDLNVNSQSRLSTRGDPVSLLSHYRHIPSDLLTASLRSLRNLPLLLPTRKHFKTLWSHSCQHGRTRTQRCCSIRVGKGVHLGLELEGCGVWRGKQ